MTIYLPVDVIDRCDDMRKVVIAVPSKFGVTYQTLDSSADEASSGGDGEVLTGLSVLETPV